MTVLNVSRVNQAQERLHTQGVRFLLGLSVKEFFGANFCLVL